MFAALAAAPLIERVIIAVVVVILFILLTVGLSLLISGEWKPGFVITFIAGGGMWAAYMWATGKTTIFAGDEFEDLPEEKHLSQSENSILDDLNRIKEVISADANAVEATIKAIDTIAIDKLKAAENKEELLKVLEEIKKLGIEEINKKLEPLFEELKPAAKQEEATKPETKTEEAPKQEEPAKPEAEKAEESEKEEEQE